MELPSPVASLVPGLVLNTVVTFGDRGCMGLRRSRLRECPFCAAWAVIFDDFRLDEDRPMTRKRKKESKANNAVLPVMRPDAAGIDIGATEIFVAVAPDRAAENVRSFPTFTQDLYALADWLKQCGVKTVAMESTGVYWIPLFQILEDRGFEVCLSMRGM